MNVAHINWISFYISFYTQNSELNFVIQLKAKILMMHFFLCQGCLSRGRKDLVLDQILTFMSKLTNEVKAEKLYGKGAIPSESPRVKPRRQGSRSVAWIEGHLFIFNQIKCWLTFLFWVSERVEKGRQIKEKAFKKWIFTIKSLTLYIS